MWPQLVKDFPAFMDKIMSFTEELNIDISDLMIDHAAVRLKEKRDVANLEKELEQYGQKLSAVIVNGRRICIFKLHQPLVYKNRAIPCVELPYPALEHLYPDDGWEHIECVLRESSPATLEETFSHTFNMDDDKRKQYNLRISTPVVSGEQLLNTTIALEKYPGLAIKFHCYPIEEVVAS